MKRSLHAATLVVPDYDRAIAFYVQTLGFHLVNDVDLSDDKRWVMVAPDREESALLLAKAVDDAQIAAIGQQTGGRVSFFLHTDDFDRDYAQMVKADIHFEEQPRDEPYGKVVVWQDPFGNRWDLLQLK